MPCNAFLHFFISHLKMASPSKPTKIVLDDDTSTNILVPSKSLKSALEKLTCLKCGEADNQKLCPITMSTKRQGIASTISLRCSKHDFNIESEIAKLDNDNNHPGKVKICYYVVQC